MKKSIKLCALQYNPGSIPLKEAMENLEPLLRGASQICDLLVLPELALTKYLFGSKKEAFSFSEVEGGNFLQYLRNINIGKSHIVAGFIEDGNDGNLYNSAYILFPDQSYRIYRKTLLFSADEAWANPGKIPYPIFMINQFRVSVGICMDLNDDNFTKFCREKSIDIVALPVNWLDQDEDVRPYWRYRLGYDCILIAANKYGIEKNIQYRGYSTIMYGDYILSEMGAVGDGILFYNFEV